MICSGRKGTVTGSVGFVSTGIVSVGLVVSGGVVSVGSVVPAGAVWVGVEGTVVCASAGSVAGCSGGLCVEAAVGDIVVSGPCSTAAQAHKRAAIAIIRHSSHLLIFAHAPSLNLPKVDHPIIISSYCGYHYTPFFYI
jgi:hypothetical protein